MDIRYIMLIASAILAYLWIYKPKLGILLILSGIIIVSSLFVDPYWDVGTLVNGDFKNGLDDWNIDSCTVTLVNGEAVINNGSGSFGWFKPKASEDFDETKNLEFRVLVDIDKGQCALNTWDGAISLATSWYTAGNNKLLTIVVKTDAVMEFSIVAYDDSIVRVKKAWLGYEGEFNNEYYKWYEINSLLTLSFISIGLTFITYGATKQWLTG